MKDWIKQVADATGKTTQTVRLAIQQGWEIGTAIKLPNSKRYEYLPHPQKIKELIGIEIGGDDDKKHSGTCRSDCDHNCACHGQTKTV